MAITPGLASAFLWAGVLLAQPCDESAPLVQVHEDFSTDPGWEGRNNRVVSDDGPTVTQDFGWSAGADGGPGAIGGTIASSTTAAWYGMPVGPFSLGDRLSAAGKVQVVSAPGRSGMYLGFFNSARQGWRPWSSLMFQFSGSKRGMSLRNSEIDGAQMWFTVVTGQWGSDGGATDLFVPADGRAHPFRFDYDPDARPDLTWPHPQLRECFRDSRMTEDDLYVAAAKHEANLQRSELRRRLEAAAAQALVIYDPRRGTDYWELRPDAAELRGAATIAVAARPPQRVYLAPAVRAAATSFDRFGIVNQQTYGRAMQFEITDLAVNGSAIDLSRDPAWQGHGNRTTFVERDFHARQDFGYSDTNWAGESAGELGGTFWRTEPVDPLCGYYAQETCAMTLDDPMSFAGCVAFVEGQPDSAMWIGYFNAAEAMATITDESAGWPTADSMGIVIDGPSRVGYYFTAFCAPTRALASRREGPVFLPTRERRHFRWNYDPRGNDGAGRIAVTLDDETFTLDLTAAQRAAGARFDRFGVAAMRAGGKFVTIYFDDLDYTVRRAPGEDAPRHRQEIIRVPYPDGGRRY